jgi:hypothetical protein
MAELDDLRKRLGDAERRATVSRDEALSARIRAAATPDDAQLAGAAAAAAERAKRADALRGEAFGAFIDFSDPRQTIGLMDDSVPLLLMPLRLETRFVSTPTGDVVNHGVANHGAIRHELLVRVYPDDCSIHAFDPELSTAEVDSIQRFWQETWRAGGVDAEARAAWRNLAGGYGPGRAAWLVQAVTPLNPGDQPTKLAATDIILVIAGSALPNATDRVPIGSYWRAVWKANGDQVAIAAARSMLVSALGDPQATDAIAKHVPFNLGDPPPGLRTVAETGVKVAWLELPATMGEERVGWRRAPTAHALPERLVLLLESGDADLPPVLGNPIIEPLYTGPDPMAPDEERIIPENGKLKIPPQLQWMFDFPTAEKAGMGFRVPLTAAQAAAGFDRLIVIGIRLRDGADEGRTTFEELLRGHSFGRSGFEILAQGVATNNSEDTPSAYARRQDPDLAYDDVLGPPKFAVKTDPLDKRDGQVLAERLGLDPRALEHIRGADGRDAIDAQAMNTALAPGTLGYMAGTLMGPVLGSWADELQWFFGSHVTGRGPMPAVRVGAQPYGIVASTAFTRISWLDPERGHISIIAHPLADRRLEFMRRLHSILEILEANWRQQVGSIGRVGEPGADPHATLLDILGLHSNSVEFYSRAGKSLDELSSRGLLAGLGKVPSQRAQAAAQRQAALQMLRTFGYSGEEEPQILDLFFRSRQILLSGPLVQAPPLAEQGQLTNVTDDNRNYVAWLASAAAASVDTLRRQEGFVDDTVPNSLLYIMLHFALMRGYQDASTRLRILSGLFEPTAIAALRHEPTSVHLSPSAAVSDSAWVKLYEPDVRLTGKADLSIADHITLVLGSRPQYAVDLADQIAAVQVLSTATPASLERCLVEHIDTVCCRFDSWRLGLVDWQLDQMRNVGADAPAKQGQYLGAYGYLEDVRPKAKPLQPVTLDGDLAAAFAEGPSLVLDPTNGGHLHAPSLNQAVTAAILRAGELANRTPGAPHAFSINLASERVRLAVALLDGVRNGQSLGALLGYRFERALHDAGGFVELDAVVFAFRRAFPLTADKLKPTQDPPPPATEAIEARNVVDGLALVTRAGTTPFPYGVTLAGLGPTQEATVRKAVQDLSEVFDALADMALAEGVHHAAQGNIDRAAAHIDVASTFTAPPHPDVVRTPARGFALTCRVGIELDATAVAAVTDPPRAAAQPSVNAWLAGALPPLSSIACRAILHPAAGAPPPPITITLADLGLTPIDVIDVLADMGGTGSAELDDRVRRHVITSASPRPDTRIDIRYMEAGPGQLSIFVASSITSRLRGITRRSRPLRASDVALPGGAATADAVAHVVDRNRVADVVTTLQALVGQIDAEIASAKLLLDDPVANRGALIAGIDAQIADVVERLAHASLFGGARAGWGTIYDWRTERFITLLAQLSALVDRWTTRLSACDDLLTQESLLTGTATDDERIKLLRAAEAQVSTDLAMALDPAALRLSVEAKRTAFDTKRTSIQTSTVAATNPGLADRIVRVNGMLPISAFDPEPFTITEFEDSVVAYAADLQAMLQAVRNDLDVRLATANAALVTHDQAVDAPGRLKALDAAAEAILGEGFALVPTFTLPVAAAAEQTAAHAAFVSGALLAHARSVSGDDHPLDTWFYGVARVRPKVRLLEDATMLWEAHGLNVGGLNAMQLPHRAGAPWLALDFPKADAPDGERLAYVGFAGAAFDPAASRCGLLLDDWSETIPAIEADEPGPKHTTGVAFHFDRPSQEPPQAMLLLTPAAWNGRWEWDDVVHGIIDTFELAKIRAVEPTDLEQGPLAQFLPATVASVTTSGLSLSANFALMNMSAKFVRSD